MISIVLLVVEICIPNTLIVIWYISSAVKGVFYALCLSYLVVKEMSSANSTTQIIVLVALAAILYGLAQSFFFDAVGAGFVWLAPVPVVLALSCQIGHEDVFENEPRIERVSLSQMRTGRVLLALLLGVAYGLPGQVPSVVLGSTTWSMAAVIAGLLILVFHVVRGWPNNAAGLVAVPLVIDGASLFVSLALPDGGLYVSLLATVGQQITLFAMCMFALLSQSPKGAFSRFAGFFCGATVGVLFVYLTSFESAVLYSIQGMALLVSAVVLMVMATNRGEGRESSEEGMSEPFPYDEEVDVAESIFEGHGLTEREAEVALLFSRGYTLRRVASELGVSESTVSSQVQSTYKKLKIHSKQELIDLLREE